MEKNIELELRAEVSLDQLDALSSNLQKKQKLLSHDKRLSVMFLGMINKDYFDIRVRINSHRKAELVVKKGDYHAHDRVESSQEIKKDQFIGIVKILSLFGFQAKVTERENFTFDLGDGTTMVLVRAGSIAYIEIEKMSHEGDMDKNKAELLGIVKNFDLKLIKDDHEFNELCDRLTKYCDWPFDGTPENIKKLDMMLELY